MPALFLKRLVGDGYQRLKGFEREFNVKVTFNKAHLSEDVYPLHFLTQVALKGKSENVKKLHAIFKEELQGLVARRRYLNRSDIKIITNRLSAIKKEIAPVEIRYSKDNALRDINHPFFTIYYKDKEVCLIGRSEEIAAAERCLFRTLEQSRYRDENLISLNYLIPVCNKSHLIAIKNRVEKRYAGSKMIIYDPLHPRKNVSLTLCSTYKDFESFYHEVRHYLDSQKLYHGLFEHYQKQMLYQMSKYFFKYLQNFKQTRSMVFMKSWDTITAEFDETSPHYYSIYSILESKISSDYEFRFYILRVNEMCSRQKLSRWGMSLREFILVLLHTLNRKNEYDFMKERSIFFSSTRKELPPDYHELVSCSRAFPCDELKSLKHEGDVSKKTLSIQSLASPADDGTLTQLHKRESKEHSSSNASSFFGEENAVALKTSRLNDQTGESILPQVQREVSGNKGVPTKESLSSAEVSIHYRESSLYKKGFRQRARIFSNNSLLPRAIPLDNKSSSSISLSSSSISENGRNISAERNFSYRRDITNAEKSSSKKINKHHRKSPRAKEYAHKKYGMRRNK